MKKALIILLCYVVCILTENHTLHWYCTAISGIADLPQYMEITVVDDKVLRSYDTGKNVPMKQCIKDLFDQQFLDARTKESKRREHYITNLFHSIQKQKHEENGTHVFQVICYCQVNDEGKVTPYTETYRYDGEDCGDTMPHEKGLIQQSICHHVLNLYVKNGKECLNRTEPPDVSLYFNHSSDSLAVCHATGFYPKEMSITWKRDGQEMRDIVVGSLNGILPNGDGTFQKRIIVSVSPEERKKSTYTCEVNHKSGELIIKTLEGNSKNDFWMPFEVKVGVGVVGGLGLVGLVAVAVKYYQRKRQDQEATSSCCLELPDRNDTNSSGSAGSLMAGDNNDEPPEE